jgi:hypothetical protein
MRRDALARLGIQLPVLPTIALGGLPGGAGWAARLERIGLDVVASGASPDTPETWAAARAEVPHRPVKGIAGDVGALDLVGCRIVETSSRVPDDVYRLGPDEAIIPAVVGTDPAVEDFNDVGRAILRAAREGMASELWAAATPGLHLLPPEVVEAKLAALVEGARQARLALAKEQFDL